jgi:hypothetical protein
VQSSDFVCVQHCWWTGCGVSVECFVVDFIAGRIAVHVLLLSGRHKSNSGCDLSGSNRVEVFSATRGNGE